MQSIDLRTAHLTLPISVLADEHWGVILDERCSRKNEAHLARPALQSLYARY